MLIFCCVVVVATGCEKPPAGASLSSVSENGAHRVTIVEKRHSPRRFEIWLERVKDGYKTNIYRSPHETPGFGTERIVWRDDHSQFVVIGRNLFVNNPPIVPMETLYLLYDLPTGKLWCNSIEGNHRPFSETNIQAWRGSYENDRWRMDSRFSRTNSATK